jgi:signal transduction histidine kinase
VPPSRPIKLPLRVVTEEELPTTPAEPEDLNLRVLRPLFRFVRERHGEESLHRILREAGIDSALLQRSSPWISHGAFEAILSGCRELVPSDAAFMKACVHDIQKVYGPMSLVLRSMTVGTTYRALARTSHLVSKVSHYKVASGTRNTLVLRYFSNVPDSHLSCLSRQAQLASLAAMWWGIPEAVVTVNARLCDGDPYCEYHLAWKEPLQVRYAFGGAVLGLLSGFALARAGVDVGAAGPYLLAALGAAAGLLFQMRRLLLDYLAMAEQTSYEVEQVVQAHARAVDELLALHQRERAWSTSLENRYHERRERLEQVVEALDGGNDVRDDKLLNLSHDMNNPLTVLLAGSTLLERTTGLSDDERETVSAMSAAVGRIQTLMGEMSGIVRRDAAPSTPDDDVDVDELANRIRRQLRATVMGRDLRVTVFQTREAPKSIVTDAIVLERVIDNLLTNATKYTERGSIVVEVGGTPGNLLLKISDTGKGIGEDRLEQVFISGRPDKNPLLGTSHGDGLSIVVRLLDQLSGRLEVMSNPDEGTTLWVSVPVSPTPSAGGEQASDTPLSRFERVVKIRPRA